MSENAPAGKEIERKFLVDVTKLPMLPPGTVLTQGYIAREPAVRIRTWDGGAMLTIKGKGTVERDEVNFDVPIETAELALKLFGKFTIRKTRTIVNYAGRTWEVDHFHDLLEGLCMAEIELGDANETFDMPPWVGREVSENPRYSNASLAALGLPPDHDPGDTG